MGGEQAGFAVAQPLAFVGLGQRLLGQRHAADLRQHGADFDLPGVVDLEFRAKRANQPLDARSAAEGRRIGHREDVDQHLHAAAQRAVQRLPLGRHRSMAIDAFVQHLGQALGGARLGDETEDGAFVDGVDGHPLVGVTGQHHARNLGSAFLDLGQQLDAVHSRHVHVGDNHGERSLALQQRQRLLAAERRFDVVLAVQLALEGGQHIGFVIDKQHAAFSHCRPFPPLAPGRPARRFRAGSAFE
ncbi:MAG: hypothetical protein BWZ10_03370 [candidate division BRC1 bacterium ADurb.BinA364]|nr:MAG: hypothetical protein BWZ10_03370 [candidate division BRC1 bacterium ADurb.BinA364]